MSLLRQRDFAAIWTAGFISETGDWLLIIALPLYIFGVTGSVLSTSTLFLAELLPAMLVGTFAGVLVDRWDARRTMIGVALLQAVLLLPLLAVTRERLWLLYVVAATQALLVRVYSPAKQSLLLQRMPPDRLQDGNALISVNENLARLVGSPLGGLFSATLGLREIVAIDAGTYLVGAGLVAFAGGSTRDVDRGQGAVPAPFLREWMAGLAVVRRSRQLSALFVVTVLSQLAQGMFVVLFLVFVLRTLHAGDSGVGLLRGVQAIGAVGGGLVVGALGRRFSSRRLFAGGLFAVGALSLTIWNLPYLTTWLGLYVGLFLVVGAPGIAVGAGLVTEVQLLAPAPMVGRVFAALETSALGGQAVGLIAAGAAAAQVDVVTLLDVQGGLYLCSGGLAVHALRQNSRGLPTVTAREPALAQPGSPG